LIPPGNRDPDSTTDLIDALKPWCRPPLSFKACRQMRVSFTSFLALLFFIYDQDFDLSFLLCT